jgi:hypothetical protein
MQRGYDEFDRLCRAAYASVLPNWDCVIVPWEQILSDKSEDFIPAEDDAAPPVECPTCGKSRYGTCKAPDNAATAGREQAGAIYRYVT